MVSDKTFASTESNNITQSEIAIILDTLSTAAAYFRNFDIVRAFTDSVCDPNQKISLAWDYFDWNYNPINKSITPVDGCTNYDPVIWDPDYYMCYTYRPSASMNRSSIFGWSGIFFIDTFDGNDVSPFALDLRNSRATGLRVAIHTPSSVPNMKQGITIGPGTETTITLTQTQRSMQPAPYSSCTKKATLGAPDAAASETDAYTEDYCFDACMQRAYVKECNCVFSDMQATYLQLQNTNFTVNHYFMNFLFVFQQISTWYTRCLSCGLLI